MQDGEAYAYLLSTLAPELSSKTMIETSDPKERAQKVLETAEKLDCTRYVTRLFTRLIIRLFQLVFSAETVFFSHNKSANNVFQQAYQPSRTG
jgi:hypothetical protein